MTPSDTPIKSPDSVADSTDTPESITALLADDQYTKYMLSTKAAMAPVLRGLIEHVSQITLFFNEGRDMVLSSLISFDENGLLLDYGPSSEMNRKALAAEKLFCITQLDKVKIQFLLRGVRSAEAGGLPAFRAVMPEGILRLQRREYFRLTLPITRPLKMVMPLVVAKNAPQMLEVSVGDISGGGLGIVNLSKDAQLATGMKVSGCRMDLPEVGQITATIRVCSLMDATNRGGVQSRRAGCEFVDLPGPMLTLIQRYIIKMERERKARESGMA